MKRSVNFATHPLTAAVAQIARHTNIAMAVVQTNAVGVVHQLWEQVVHIALQNIMKNNFYL